MEVKPAKREWVKNAAIIFLAVLLVLTFFSNTIMNRTLPEAATAYVTSGTITAKVRGSGKVVANGLHEVKTDQTRTVRAVMVKAGQEVSTGDVLFVMGQGDSKELEAAKESLRQLQLSYQQSAVGMPVFDYTLEEYNLEAAGRDYDATTAAANKALADYEKYVGVFDSDGSVLTPGVYEPQRLQLLAAEERLTALQEQYAVGYDAITDYVLAQDEVTRLKNTGLGDDSEEVINANAAVVAANDYLNSLGITERTIAAYNTSVYDGKVVPAQNIVETYRTEYERLTGQYQKAYDTTSAEMSAAEQAYYSALYTLENKKASDSQSLASSSVTLQGISQQIEIQQQKIKELSGDEGNQILATVNGVVDSIGISSGDTATADTVLCTIEVPDMGHSLSFSVTKDQAQRLRVGDSATVSNYYWGKEIVATLTNIKNDPKNPQSNRILTFDLTGDVTSGSELTISVGQKSANYDLIIPNSSIRSDTNGSFVLAVDAKNSPLGNRYITRRVNVEVLASDDLNSAVTGGLNNGDYVVTTSSAPVKAGDQVRMAEASS